MYSNHLHFHFTGIGGSGMSGIAEILLNSGFNVSGSDLNDSETCKRLKEKGAQIFIGHNSNNLPKNADLLVHSSAINYENCEIIEALKRDIPVIRRAEVLAELMRLKFGVGVAGSHGKTTTTSMLGAILEEADLDPTVIIGGIVKAHGSGARYGKGDYLIAESDESDKSFLLLKPTIAIITNIDLEHLNAYKSVKELEDSFLEFANSVPFYGVAILCIDNQRVRDIANNYKRRKITYGLAPDADLRAELIKQEKNHITYNVYIKNEFFSEITLPMPGTHLMLNSLAAIAVALEFSVSKECIKNALNSFKGVGRRSEILGTVNDITIIDDYAHHPTEIKSTLKAITTGWSQFIKRTFVVFQPHRYSRTRDCFAEFLGSFENIDKLYISDIYSAGEEPLKDIKSSTLAKAITSCEVKYIKELSEINKELKKEVEPGDLVIFLGAGSVSKYANSFLKDLQSA